MRFFRQQGFRFWCNLGLYLFLLLLAGAAVLPAAKQIYQSPPTQRIAKGQTVNLFPGLPQYLASRLRVSVQPARTLETGPGQSGQQSHILSSAGMSDKTGQYRLRVSLLGLIPLRQLAVEVVSPPKVMVSGQSIGVLLQTNGVTVVGFSGVNRDGQEIYPARNKGLQPGDVVLSINGVAVENNEHAGDLIDQAGLRRQPAAITLRRGKKNYTVTLDPVFDPNAKRYRVGLLIRDSAAGVGTLTFYDSKTRTYGALGHLVADVANQPLTGEAKGEIVAAVVQGIQEGERGRPGEKIGLFQEGRGFSGSIDRNTRYGIFGQLEALPGENYYPRPLPVAMLNQVLPGPAELLTVVRGDRVQRFSLKIERICPGEVSTGRGLVVRINDPELLELAGGIVQGMSGSPIVQNGLFVGAITHVFVNDPTMGYGVPAEWMIQEVGLLEAAVTSQGGATLPFLF